MTVADPTLSKDALKFRQDDDVLARDYEGTTYQRVRDAIFANPYQDQWGDRYQRPWPQYRVSLWHLLRAGFQQAANRTVDSLADLRFGHKARGYRRIVHPNGICLTGEWRITERNDYSGYFKKNSRGLVIGRISSNSTATTRDHNRAFSLVGKIFPTTDVNDETKYRPANFFTQDDFGGSDALRITDVEMRNAPDVHAFRRGPELPILIRTGSVLRKADFQPLIRQLYPIAELGLDEGKTANTPRFMRLTASPGHLVIDEDDFRDEVMAHIYDRDDDSPVLTPKRELRFDIWVANEGEQLGKRTSLRGLRWIIRDWQKIGVLAFKEAVASYNGDFVIHFHHPPWRDRVNDPSSLVRRDQKLTR